MADPYDLPDPQSLINGLSPEEIVATSSLGIDQGQYQQAMQYTGGNSPLSGGTPIAASKGEFHTFEAIFWGEGNSPLNSAMAYYDFDEMGYDPSVQFDYTRGGTPVGYGKQISRREDPAPITLVPTSTTNPLRPRTVAAGYDSGRRTLTCVFRDGTYYNYYEVTPLEWGNFKRARSKGKYIYTYLDSHPRGMANVAQMPNPGRELLYRITRSQQLVQKGLQPGQSARSRRGTGRNTYGKRRV